MDRLEAFDEHDGGQLRIGAQGDQLSALPLPDEGIPDAGHVETPAEREQARRRDVHPLTCGCESCRALWDRQ